MGKHAVVLCGQRKDPILLGSNAEKKKNTDATSEIVQMKKEGFFA